MLSYSLKCCSFLDIYFSLVCVKRGTREVIHFCVSTLFNGAYCIICTCNTIYSHTITFEEFKYCVILYSFSTTLPTTYKPMYDICAQSLIFIIVCVKVFSSFKILSTKALSCLYNTVYSFNITTVIKYRNRNIQNAVVVLPTRSKTFLSL